MFVCVSCMATVVSFCCASLLHFGAPAPVPVLHKHHHPIHSVCGPRLVVLYALHLMRALLAVSTTAATLSVPHILMLTGMSCWLLIEKKRELYKTDIRQPHSHTATEHHTSAVVSCTNNLASTAPSKLCALTTVQTAAGCHAKPLTTPTPDPMVEAVNKTHTTKLEGTKAGKLAIAAAGGERAMAGNTR